MTIESNPEAGCDNDTPLFNGVFMKMKCKCTSKKCKCKKT